MYPDPPTPTAAVDVITTKAFVLSPRIAMSQAEERRRGANVGHSELEQVQQLYKIQTNFLASAGFYNVEIADQELCLNNIRINKGGGNSRALFIEAHVSIDPTTLRAFVTQSERNTVLISRRTSHLADANTVFHFNRRLLGVGANSDNYDTCIDQLFGIAIFDEQTAMNFLGALGRGLNTSPMAEALSYIIGKNDINVLRIDDDRLLTSRGGGSYATSMLVTRFRKEAGGLGQDKLRDEISFLEKLKGPIVRFYPKLYSAGEVDGKVFLEEEYVPYKTLRHHIFAGNVSAQNAAARLEKILDLLTTEIYRPTAHPPAPGHLQRVYFSRVLNRLSETMERSEVLSPLITASRLWINGVAHYNIHGLLAQIQTSDRMTSVLEAKEVFENVHGDMHFANILIDSQSDDFRLVDPRGFSTCDIFYDLGKISHSTNGKYDFLHEDKFLLAWEARAGDIEAQLVIPASDALTRYAYIDGVMRNLYKDLTGDSMALEKTLFAEAMHFCAMMPFHLAGDKKETRAVAIYLTGVVLLNDLVKRLSISVEELGSSFGCCYRHSSKASLRPC